MTPSKAFERLVCGMGILLAGRNRRPTGRTTRWYLERGKEIPDFDLPGRLLMLQTPEVREALCRLTAADTWHNADETKALATMWNDETERLFERIAHRR